MTDSFQVVDVRETGPRSMVGLKSDRLSDESIVQRLFDELDQLVRTSGCEVLAIDLEGIRLLPSHFIGQLVSLRRRVRIELLNTSEYVGLVLQTARLSKLFEATADSEPVSDSEPV
jgi:anti-sigma B factor antagonist